MMIKTITFFGLLAIAASPCCAQLYMDASTTMYEFDLNGNLLTSAGYDPPLSGHVGSGISIGSDNRVYFGVHGGTNRVDRFDANLTNQTSFVGEGQGSLFVPLGNTFGPDGNLYVVNQGNSAINRYFGPASATPGGNDPSAGHSGAVWASVSGASFLGIAFAPDGSTLYVSDQSNSGSIDAFNAITGAMTVVATNLGAPGVGDIAIDAAGTSLFVRDDDSASSGHLKVKKFTIKPDHSLISVPFSINSSQLDGSYGLAFGPDGSLYATTREPNGSLDPLHNEDYVMKIDPNTGNTAAFITAGQNDFINPQFLRFAPVPEPGALTLAILAGAIALATRPHRRRCQR